MDREERKNKITHFRKETIIGKCVDLKPATALQAEQIVRLRNKPRNRYYFNQDYELETEGQKAWFETYEKRDDDIYWCVYRKDGLFIGTIRLYGIDLDGEYCEEGSYAIDEDYADEAPYAVESKMLVLDVAFDELQIKTMINDNRADNKVMNNIDNQLGFDKGEKIQIRGVDYLHRILKAGDYRKNRAKFSSLVDYWSRR